MSALLVLITLAVAESPADRELPVAAMAPGRGPTLFVAATGGADWVFGLPVIGGGALLRLGGALRRVAMHGSLAGHLGRTPKGLRGGMLRLGFALEVLFGRLRLGAVVQTGYLALHRVTRSDWMEALTQGLGVAASFDVAKAGSVTFVLGAAGELDFMIFATDDPGPILGARAVLGVRL